jgi:hypothetical protein
MNDAGPPIAYQALAAGTDCYDRNGTRVGRVERVLAVEEEDVFDGIVISTDQGTRFIDAANIARIAEHRVDINLTSAEVANQPEHEESAPIYEARVPSGRLQDLWRRFSLRRLWRRDS